MIKRQKHNYTNEFELKSLLIRVKNVKTNKTFSGKDNKKINKYILWLDKISKNKYKDVDIQKKKSRIRKKLKDSIISLSEQTNIDELSYERFGDIVLLMIKNILKKPQFSGYTYRDDFYSDSSHKILKYLHNFDHTLISDISGQYVSSFAYITQIIHNSIKFIINQKNKQQKTINKQLEHTQGEYATHAFGLKTDSYNKSTYNPDEHETVLEEIIELKKIETTLCEYILSIQDRIEQHSYVKIIYPSDYRISMEEYSDIKPLLNSKMSITRKEND